MGVCGCTDKSSRAGAKNIIGSNNNTSGLNHEGGDQLSNSNSMIFEEPNNRPMMKPRDMHIRNNEFRRMLNTKFKDHQILE